MRDLLNSEIKVVSGAGAEPSTGPFFPNGLPDEELTIQEIAASLGMTVAEYLGL